MEQRYKDRLPANIQRLVDAIESFAALEIDVQLDPRSPSPTEPNPESPASATNHDSATIFIRSEEIFAPQGVLHELLHIHRYWVEAVPQVMPAKGDQDSDERWRITSQIENALEHLVIVPREAEYGFDPYPYWNEDDNLDDCEAGTSEWYAARIAKGECVDELEVIAEDGRKIIESSHVRLIDP